MLVITIPIYKPQPSLVERFNLEVSLSTLAGNFPIVLLMPRGLDASAYLSLAPTAIKLEVDPAYFQSANTYSQLCLQPSLYQALSNFEYMLLLQPDAILLRDELIQWANRGYAYVGAPIGVTINVLDPNLLDGLAPNNTTFTQFIAGTVGNGGFSLRNIAATLNVLTRHAAVAKRFEIKGLNEDLFFAACATFDPEFRTPSSLEAARFAIEMHGAKFLELTHQLPVGLHAWDRYDPVYWRKIFSLLGIYPPENLNGITHNKTQD